MKVFCRMRKRQSSINGLIHVHSTSILNDYVSGHGRRFICTILTIIIALDSWPTDLKPRPLNYKVLSGYSTELFSFIEFEKLQIFIQKSLKGLIFDTF